MKTEILKFGGAALASPQQIKKIAPLIAKKYQKNKRIVVVVSAMGRTTDELLFLAHQVHPSPSKREQDMLISVGERVSIALLAMALSEEGIEAISFTGSQSGIITNEEHSQARIVSVRPHRLIAALDLGKVAIVAGFQGVSLKGEITTLGRGGSDTSAVALGVALEASQIKFFKDVPGICTADPKIDPQASCLPILSYKEAMALAEQGARVLHPRAIALAEKNGIALRVIPFYAPEAPGTLVHSPFKSSVFPIYEVSSPFCLVEAEDEQMGRRIQATLFRLIKEKGIKEELLESFPLFHSDRHEQLFTLTLIARHKPHIARFFYDMLSRWLLPGHQVEISTFFSTTFYLPELEEQRLAFQELRLNCRTAREADVVVKSLALLEREIALGASSFYHANKILEMKGFSLDDKTALIQERIAYLVRRFRGQFDYDIFGEMQRFFAASQDAFKSVREMRHISALIYTLYFFRKKLERLLAISPMKRHVLLKLKKNILHTPLGAKEVLSVYLGLNFLKEHEVFEERHLLSALMQFLPEAKSVAQSFYLHDMKEEYLGFLYLEIEKENGEHFTPIELKRFLKLLPDEIRSRIEQLVSPIFMPRNEEEVMRGILTLSNELRYARDIPQMIISFDEQTHLELVFTVILARLQHPDSLPIKELFESSALVANFSFDRIKQVGMLRGKIPKEVAVLRAYLPLESFYREDYSVDLSAARSALATAIQKTLGEVRDFNGGMIAKQSENFAQLKKILEAQALKHPMLLQNFFHAIYPSSLSATLDPQLLKIFFLMLLEAVESSREEIILRSKKANDHLFVMVQLHDLGWKQKIFHHIEKLSIPSNTLVSIQLHIFDVFYIGFLYLATEREKQQLFLEAIPKALACQAVT